MSFQLGKSPVLVAAAAAAVSMLFGSAAQAAFDVVDKNIPQFEAALASGQTTDVSVVQQYLSRIAAYNRNGGGDGTLGKGGTGINAVAQLNPNVLADAANVDALIKAGATTAQFPLLGVPVLVKNSYDVKGLTTTNGVSIFNGSGTPGSTVLTAPTDSPGVASLKAAGAIIIGKASLSTMAYSYDGIDNANGVVENPYNPLRQPGGSSSGTGAGISSQFALLGMGGETGGSIRVPSAYDADVGLKTSAGLINPAGTFPLTPTRDVIGPIAKSVTDIAYALNALVKPVSGDLFSGTAFYPTGTPQPGVIGTGLGEGTDPSSKGLTSVTGTRPADYTTFLNPHALQGKTIAIENDIIPSATSNMSSPAGAFDGTINTYVYANFQRAVGVLQAEGATIVHVDLPATLTYYNSLGRTTANGGPTTSTLKDSAGNLIPYPSMTTTTNSSSGVVTTTPNVPNNTYSSYAAAYYYNQQILGENNPTIKNIDDFATALLNGLPKDASGNPITTTGSKAPATVTPGSGSPYSTLISAYNNIAALAKIYDAGQAKGFDNNPDAQTALAAFTTLRQQEYDDFLTANNIDAFVAPTIGSLPPLVAAALRGSSAADPLSTNPDGSANGTASLIGRFEGNILGLPALAVPDGFVQDGSPVGVPTGIQFLGRLDGEATIIADGYDYEQASLALGEGRIDPNLSFVPEPGTLSLLAVAGGFLSTRRGRRTRTA